MPEIYLYNGKEEIHRIQIANLCHKLPCNQSDVAIIDTGLKAKNYRGKEMLFIRIEGSIDMTDEDLIAIANHFAPHIDVSIRNGEGRKVYRGKGKKFEPDCFYPKPRQPRGGPKPQ